MKRPLLLVLTFFVLGAAPTPLVVGSVRDQEGAPIAGATVRLRGAAAAGSSQTATDGTFAIPGAGSVVEIRCDYCRPTDVPVAADGTVTAVVQRYDAVRLEGPSPTDLANLPYTHAESAVSLTPWIVLEQNANPLFASSLHDRSVSTVGGLLVLDGVPDYNSADGWTTYGTIPYNSAADVDVDRVPQAFEYGNVASAGTFSVTTTGGTPLVAAGSSVIGALSVNSTNAAAIGYSSDGSGTRTRGTALFSVPLPNATLQAAVASGDGQIISGNQATLNSSFSSYRLAYERTSGADLYASVTGDRGTDAFTSSLFDSNDLWSDFDARVGVRSRAVVAPFAEVSTNDSTGWFWAPTPEYSPYVAGTIDQTRAYAGVNATLPWATANVVYGINGIRFVNTFPGMTTTSINGNDASATLDLHPTPEWSLQGSASSGYLLQTVFGAYNASEANISPLNPMSSDELDLTFQDLQRVRVGLTSFGTRSLTIDDTSAGAFVAWQIAPSVSLRTWWLDVHPQTGSPQSVGSAWLTANAGAIRFDVIWRRDLYDLAGNAHLDGAVSGPINVRARWFAQTEQFGRARLTNVGIRF
jgi:hypothetical protein